jgi:putative transcriptional regulator
MKKSILEVIHESAKGLFDIGLVDAKTMHTFDALCLHSGAQRIRLREKLRQPVFAEYLNASTSTIKKWETGEKHPTGPALKLLNIVVHRSLQAILYDEQA